MSSCSRLQHCPRGTPHAAVGQLPAVADIKLPEARLGQTQVRQILPDEPLSDAQADQARRAFYEVLEKGQSGPTVAGPAVLWRWGFHP